MSYIEKMCFVNWRFRSFVQYSFAEKLVACLLLSYRCIATINVLWLYLTVPWVCLQFVIVVFPDYTNLLVLKLW